MKGTKRNGLGWGVVGLLLNTAPALAAEVCPPTVALSGPGEVVRPLTAALVARGVRVEPGEVPPGVCERLTVTLSPAAEGVTVSIVDPWGRSTERTVKELLTSASLIESWARLDLLDGVATSSVVEAKVTASAAPVPVPVVPPPSSAATEPVGVQSNAPPKNEPNLSLRVLAEGGVARDRGKWMGGSVAACAHLGLWCLGVEGRYARGEQGENAAEGLLILEAPLRFGILTLTPGIGAGAGWIGGERGGRINPLDPRGRGPRFGDADRNAEGFGPRAEVRLGLALSLTDQVALEVGASAVATPELRRGVRGLVDPEQAVLRAQGGLVWSFE